MGVELKNWKLKFEDLGGYVRAVKQKIKRPSKAKKHPFLEEQKLVREWAAKLASPEGLTKIDTSKIKLSKIKKAKKTITARKKATQRTPRHR